MQILHILSLSHFLNHHDCNEMLFRYNLFQKYKTYNNMSNIYWKMINRSTWILPIQRAFNMVYNSYSNSIHTSYVSWVGSPPMSPLSNKVWNWELNHHYYCYYFFKRKKWKNGKKKMNYKIDSFVDNFL